MAAVDIPRICLDTGPLIQYLLGKEPGATAVETVVQSSACYVTSITAYELLFDAARSRHRLDEQDLLSIFEILSFDAPSAHRAAQLHAELISRNQDIGVKDVMIASICLTHELPLLTTNIRHFEHVPSLHIYPVDNFVK